MRRIIFNSLGTEGWGFTKRARITYVPILVTPSFAQTWPRVERDDEVAGRARARAAERKRVEDRIVRWGLAVC